MSPSETGFLTLSDFDQGIQAAQLKRMGQDVRIFGIRKFVLMGCIVLSLLLHALSGWMADFRPVPQLVKDRLLLLDIVALSDETVSPAAQVPVAEKVTPRPVTSSDVTSSVSAASSSPVRKPVPEVKAVSKEKSPPAQSKPRAQAEPAPERVRNPSPALQESVKSKTPIGQIVPRAGVTVLANESGQDALKHGAEARFMHGVATEEFVEENYVGEYSMGKSGKVWIEDDRAGSGHLILHAETMGLRRQLFRFNRFIYVYGESPDSPEPILGSVTFFSDGYHINNFLWQHNSTHAYYPRRE
ncbi:hypothetical protein [Desulfomicrobium baculatum]|uniref:Uncharacterized protein n=1 Tax=Desulfomicrobium baculatum (strain DSM 4028 / VKM B-1378 / X) TaxID=525897 RepID=C7LN90_DESBD|nr:hypothetical protein [Desulfomicrobium baculatum]ACU90059.1 hypothetical protein Dbac_1971 [Desulfomicrobium baculatum DSM 4028]